MLALLARSVNGFPRTYWDLGFRVSSWSVGAKRHCRQRPGAPRLYGRIPETPMPGSVPYSTMPRPISREPQRKGVAVPISMIKVEVFPLPCNCPVSPRRRPRRHAPYADGVQFTVLECVPSSLRGCLDRMFFKEWTNRDRTTLVKENQHQRLRADEGVSSRLRAANSITALIWDPNLETTP